jgi:hypothetical protein
MSTEESSKTDIIVKSIEKISESKGVGEIGKGFGAGLVGFAWALGIVGGIFALQFGSKWDGHLYPQERCFEIKEISGKTFKVNNCTGEVSEINLNQQK